MTNAQQEENWVVALLRRHPALLVSVLYVTASTIGMLFAWDYLRLFGINVFNYAQVGDFLLASLKEPFTWAIVFISILLVAADNAMSRIVERKSSSPFLKWYGSGRYRAVNYIVAIMLIVVFIHSYALLKRNAVLDGESREVSVQLADSADSKKVVMLGTTGQFLFLYDVESARVDIHPHENVASISFIIEKGEDDAPMD